MRSALKTILQADLDKCFIVFYFLKFKHDVGVTIEIITHDSNIASHAKKVYNIIDGEISQAAEKEEDHEEKN